MARQFRMDSESSAWEIATYGAYGVAVAKAREQVAHSVAHSIEAGALVQSSCRRAGASLGRVIRFTERLVPGRLGLDRRLDCGCEPTCI